MSVIITYQVVDHTITMECVHFRAPLSSGLCVTMNWFTLWVTMEDLAKYTIATLSLLVTIGLGTGYQLSS